ncbi:MAG: RDD family protein [Candidatus Competibacterales bacterium]
MVDNPSNRRPPPAADRGVGHPATVHYSRSTEPASPVSRGLPPAGVGRRLGALLYDGLLLLAVWIAASGLALAALGLVGQLSSPTGDAGPPLAGPLYQSYLVCITFGFYGFFWTHGGQTLGMRSWKIRVCGPGDSPVTWRRALQRFLAGLLAVMCLGLGLWWVWWDPRGRSWSDLWSNTTTVVDRG